MGAPDTAPPGAGGMSRRTALKLGMVGVLGAAVGAGSTAAFARMVRRPLPRYRFLSESEASLLIDICEQIIPRDDVAGATDTGAIDFIDRQLGGPYRRHRQAYHSGLESFSRTCLQAHGGPFQGLPRDKKIEALRSIERGEAPAALWGEPSPKDFFNMVLAHTMQSFYGSPRHGGNRGYASYRMLGLNYPQVVGQNRYPKA